MNIEQTYTPQNWTHFTLSNDHGMRAGILDYGGILTHMLVPDQKGQLENVVLGFRDLEDYRHNSNYLGALIGRTAGRIRNAAFEVNNHVFHLDHNEGNNHLHGGYESFSRVIWDAEPFQTDAAVGVVLTHTSPAGTAGYPGDVSTTVTYTLTNDNALTITYQAETNDITPIALTNHSYLNLSGDMKRDVHDHVVTIPSHQVAELDHDLLPTGRFFEVAGTSFDFTTGRQLRDGLDTNNRQQIYAGGGYDHYFVFSEYDKAPITVSEPVSGRKMTVTTDQPGVVMYTANGLDAGLELREGQSHKHLGVCFETQSHPATLNHDSFPSILVNPNTPYTTQTTFAFSTT